MKPRPATHDTALKLFHSQKPKLLRAWILPPVSCILSPPIPFNHFIPSLALTVWSSSCLWAMVHLVRGGQRLALVQSTKSNMLFTLTWPDPLTRTTWCRITGVYTVHTETLQRRKHHLHYGKAPLLSHFHSSLLLLLCHILNTGGRIHCSNALVILLLNKFKAGTWSYILHASQHDISAHKDTFSR